MKQVFLEPLSPFADKILVGTILDGVLTPRIVLASAGPMSVVPTTDKDKYPECFSCSWTIEGASAGQWVSIDSKVSTLDKALKGLNADKAKAAQYLYAHSTTISPNGRVSFKPQVPMSCVGKVASSDDVVKHSHCGSLFVERKPAPGCVWARVLQPRASPEAGQGLIFRNKKNWNIF